MCRCELTKAKMYISMTATLRLAERAIECTHTHSHFGVNEPNKRNANALQSGVCVMRTLVCVRSLRYAAHGSGKCYFFNIEKDLVRVHLLLQLRLLSASSSFSHSSSSSATHLSLPWSLCGGSLGLFEKNAHICWLENARAPAENRNWRWCSVSLASYDGTSYTFIYDCTICEQANACLLQPALSSDFKNKAKKENFIWIRDAWMHFQSQMSDNNALCLATRTRTVNMRAHLSLHNILRSAFE